MFLSRQGLNFLCKNGSSIVRQSIVSSSALIGSHRNLLSTSSSSSSSQTLKESYQNIIVETSPKGGNGKICVIKLNRPKALNALNDDLFSDLVHAAKSIDNDDNIRCLILMGSTSKAFAAGADISEMKNKTFEDAYGKDMFAEWQEISKLSGTPIIAAISGYCLGGGNELAMMCDIMVCTKNAKFGQPEINLGIIPGAGGTQRLTRIIGKSKSMYMSLTGDFMDANEAYTSGLVAKVYEDYDELIKESIQMANKIASKGPTSLRAAKEAINAADELSLQEGLRLERRLFHSLFATDDQKEGMAAFTEKRPANFK